MGEHMLQLAFDEQPIVAQCTAQGKGALALLRISGVTAVQIADRMSCLISGNKLVNLPTHTIHYGKVITQDGMPIDQVLFLLMRSPHTFTGQDTVEITCHNNQFIIEAIIQQAIMLGARLAHEGEFTKRAFLNNKIDLLQAEAINEMVHVQTNSGIKRALDQMHGSLSEWVKKIE